MMHSRFKNLDEKEAQGGYEEMTKNNGPLRHGPWGGVRPVLEPGWTNISNAISTAVGIGAARSGQSQPNVASRTTKQRACLVGASLATSGATTTQHVANTDNDNIWRAGRAGWPQSLKP